MAQLLRWRGLLEHEIASALRNAIAFSIGKSARSVYAAWFALEYSDPLSKVAPQELGNPPTKLRAKNSC